MTFTNKKIIIYLLLVFITIIGFIKRINFPIFQLTDLEFFFKFIHNFQFGFLIIHSLLQTLIIPISFIIVKKITTEKFALVTAFLISLSPFLINISLQPNQYSLIPFLSSILILFLIRQKNIKMVDKKFHLIIIIVLLSVFVWKNKNSIFLFPNNVGKNTFSYIQQTVEIISKSGLIKPNEKITFIPTSPNLYSISSFISKSGDQNKNQTADILICFGEKNKNLSALQNCVDNWKKSHPQNYLIIIGNLNDDKNNYTFYKSVDNQISI